MQVTTAVAIQSKGVQKFAALKCGSTTIVNNASADNLTITRIALFTLRFRGCRGLEARDNRYDEYRRDIYPKRRGLGLPVA